MNRNPEPHLSRDLTVRGSVRENPESCCVAESVISFYRGAVSPVYTEGPYLPLLKQFCGLGSFRALHCMRES